MLDSMLCPLLQYEKDQLQINIKHRSPTQILSLVVLRQFE